MIQLLSVRTIANTKVELNKDDYTGLHFVFRTIQTLLQKYFHTPSASVHKIF